MAARRSPTIAKRIVLAFAAILALFAIALAVTVLSLTRIGDAEREVAHLDHAKHAGHAVAALAREQYIHQAHTLIAWNDSHLDHYGDVVVAARAAVDSLRRMVPDRYRQHAEAIADLVAESDRRFRADVLPVVGGPDRASAGPAHDAIERVVGAVVERNERLNLELEAQSAQARTRADAIRGRTTVLIIACFALAIAVAAAVGVFLLRSIIGPMAVLRRGAERVGGGDLQHRIEIPARDEFAELAASFNEMTRDLAARHAELLEAHRLASIGQVASGVAHEINNPLGVILGYTRILRRDAQLRDREELSIIEDEVRQCQRIVSGLLDLARPVQLHRADVDVREVVREIVDRLGGAGGADGVRFETAEGPPLQITADETRLRQVVANLLANAIEAARDPSAREAVVSVSWGQEQSRAWIDIRDRGGGISADVMPRLFEPFFTTKRQGHGLGLAVARTLARAQDGDVVLEPNPDGIGARARVTLPVRAAETR